MDRLGIALSRERPFDCTGCPLHPATQGYDAGFGGAFVPPDGPPDAPLLVLGIAPAEVEEQTGIPLTGPSGKKLDSALRWALEGRPLKVRKLNAVNCRTTKLGVGGAVNRDPTAREFKECARRFLFPELRNTQAKVILVLGQLPFNLLLKARFAALHNLPKIHRFTFGLAMGHRILLPRNLFDPEVAK